MVFVVQESNDVERESERERDEGKPSKVDRLIRPFDVELAFSLDLW